jgi:hypothetical protein
VGDAAGAWFRPTPRQAAGRGLWLGLVAAAVLLAVAGLAAAVPGAQRPPWAVLAGVPPLLGVAMALLLGRRDGVRIDAAGIRPGGGEPARAWLEVADLRAERRGRCTVVQVYLVSGLVVRLAAPYDGVLLGADPAFERKVFAVAHLWRSHRIGGTTG